MSKDNLQEIHIGQQPIFQSNDQSQLLEKIDRLRELGAHRYIGLPQLVVAGDQSSGKSSVLEALTEIPFPRSAGLCTRFATQISFKRCAGPEKAKLSIIPYSNGDGVLSSEDLDKYKEFEQEVPALTSEVFEEALVRASVLMDVPSPESDVANFSKRFSEDVLCIELTGPSQPLLTVIDVPGLIRTTTGNQTEEDITLIENLTLRYIQDPKTIILAVIPANIDVANQIVLQHANKVDPEGKRTIGVITKPDLVDKGGEEEVLRTAKNRTKKLALGYYMVRNRGARDLKIKSTAKTRDSAEMAFFSEQPWNSLEKSRVGIANLKTSLERLLLLHIRREMPGLISELSVIQRDCEKRLEGMGASRATVVDQRLYLTGIITRAVELVGQALKGAYEDPVFDKCQEMRLRTRIRDATSSYYEIMIKHGNFRPFVQEDGDAEGTGGSVYQTPDGCIQEEDEEFPGTMSWITGVFQQSRGIELPTLFNPGCLRILYREMISNWEPLSDMHLKVNKELLDQFHNCLLAEICEDPVVRGNLGQRLSADIETLYESASVGFQELLRDETEGHPQTTNVLFCDGVRDSEQKIDQEEELKSYGVVQRVYNAIFDDTKKPAESLHRNLKVYYRIAITKFIDNVTIQIVERQLLRRLEHVYSHRWAAQLSDAMLRDIAGEDDMTIEERNKLQAQSHSLKAALRLLRA